MKEPTDRQITEVVFQEITCDERIYHLKSQLCCRFYREKDYYILESEALNLIGTGYTVEEAQASFFEEFDFVFRRYDELENDQLSLMNQTIKMNINHLVDHIGS